MNTLPVLLYYAMAGIVLLAIFIIIRQFMLWYWRVNEIADSIIYIANHFREIDQKVARERIEETRRTTGTGQQVPSRIPRPAGQRASGTGSPFSSMGDRPNNP